MQHYKTAIVLLLTASIGSFSKVATAVEVATEKGGAKVTSTNFNKRNTDTGEQPASLPSEVNSGVDTDYLVQPGDILVISVWKEKDLQCYQNELRYSVWVILILPNLCFLYK